MISKNKPHNNKSNTRWWNNTYRETTLLYKSTLSIAALQDHITEQLCECCMCVLIYNILSLLQSLQIESNGSPLNLSARDSSDWSQ